MLEIYQGTWVQSFSKQQKKNTKGGVQFVCTVRTVWLPSFAAFLLNSCYDSVSAQLRELNVDCLSK